MTNLHETQLRFNPKIKIKTDDVQLSNNAGLLFYAEFKHAAGLDQIIDQAAAQLSEKRIGPHYSKTSLLNQMLELNIAGYGNDVAADALQHDPVMKQVHGTTDLAPQPTISRFLSALTCDDVLHLNRLILTLALDYIRTNHIDTVMLDVDSTHYDTFGHQEAASFNAHYGVTGFHPLVAYIAQLNLLLGIKQRPGNQYTSTGVKEFLAPIFAAFCELPFDVQLILRGDSGFATPELYTLCEFYDVKYVIRLKRNAALDQLADEFTPVASKHFDQNSVIYSEFNYAAKSWSIDRRVLVKSTHQVGELFFERQYVVTNMTEAGVKLLYLAYQKRGAMENLIKESKAGFFMDKTNSHTFTTNAARATISGIAYNLIALMKLMALPKEQRNTTISTLRFQIFHVAGKLARHAGKIIIHLAQSNVFSQQIEALLANIHTLSPLVTN